MSDLTGTLAVVATPIGNLEDITLRALRVLRECDAVIAEDSRRTKALLTAHGVHKPVLSLPAFDERRRVPQLIERLERGETLALCTDAGTPALSDPGAFLVRAALDGGHRVTPIPGASALTAALSTSGFPSTAFCFLGFLPRTAGKLVRVLEEALREGRTVAFFESPMRITKTLRTRDPGPRGPAARRRARAHQSARDAASGNGDRARRGIHRASASR